MSMERAYDIVIFGVTGYTGKYVLEEAFRQRHKESLKLAVAGRNEEKIKRMLKESSDYISEPEIVNLPIIIADVSNEVSLLKMAQQTKIVLNCVGPYRFYGEQVVKACIKNGTHHFDISGEPQYMEAMQLKYNKEAEENGCYAVSACGFDSIPTEMSVKFLQNIFKGGLNEVEGFIHMETNDDMRINTGTWESAIHGLAHKDELGPLRKQLMPEKMPRSKYPAQKRRTIFYCDELEHWCLPFLGSDKSVVQRSMSYFYFQKKQHPISFQIYMSVPSFIMSIMMIIWGIMFSVMCKFEFGRSLLTKYPRIFTMGFVSPDGASRKAIEHSRMNLLFIGRGWQQKPSEDSVTKPDRCVKIRLQGPDGGYVCCSIFLVQAAITVLREADKMPARGGVYPPLAAFSETTYLDRIQTGGVEFKIVSDEVI